MALAFKKLTDFPVMDVKIGLTSVNSISPQTNGFDECRGSADHDVCS